MRLLLDTNALLWWFSGRGLSASAAAAIEAGDNAVVITVAVIWEIAIKVAIGRLDVPVDALVQEMHEQRFNELPVLIEHAVRAVRLPLHHRDPFDRMLVAQAQVEGLTIVTRDPVFTRYGIPVMAA